MKFLFLFFTFLFCFCNFSFAQSIGVSPNLIIFNVSNVSNDVQERQFLLFNPNPYPVYYSLGFDSNISFFDLEKEGSIDSFQNKKILIKFIPSKFNDLFYSGKLSVLFKNNGMFVTGNKISIIIYGNSNQKSYDFSSWFVDKEDIVSNQKHESSPLLTFFSLQYLFLFLFSLIIGVCILCIIILNGFLKKSNPSRTK